MFYGRKEFLLTMLKGHVSNMVLKMVELLEAPPNIKRSKYSSAYRFGFSVSSKKGSFAQVHRIKSQNVVLSVIIGE